MTGELQWMAVSSLEGTEKQGEAVGWLCISGSVLAAELSRTVMMGKNQDIPVGVCYGPSNQGEEEDKLFCKCLADVSPLTALLLVGDLDLPDICWKLIEERRGF